jgi:hypothetical protein
MYAVLQTSLDQSISRETLEEAVMATEALSPPDCARLVRELFGIIATNLSQGDALALQAALQARNIPTEVVEESRLPALPQPRRVRALNLTEAGIDLIDLYDKVTSYDWQHVVFAAGGGLLHLRSVQDHKLETVYVPGGRGGSSDVRAVVVTDHHFENLPEFRLELFLPVESPRVQWVLTTNSVITINDAPLRLRDADRLASLLSLLGKVLSPEQSNLGIKKALNGEVFRYPALPAFEQEIVWSLYRMARGSA